MISRTGKGFTVVELLVVIAIIGVLVALTIPAIQAARESANKTVCANNLGQLSKAVMLYSTARDQMPYSRQVYNVNGQPVVLSWVYPLLPDLEQQGIYDEIRDLGIPATELKLEVTVCPSQPEMLSPRPISYVVNGGRQNFTGSSRVNEDPLANGAFIDMAMGKATTGKTKRRWDDCKDGTTNTLLIAENLSAFDWLIPYGPGGPPALASDKEQYSQFLWFPDPTTAIAPNRHANPSLRSMDVTAADFDADVRYARPASFHSSGFTVAFWDGSTRFLNDSIDYEVYARLMSSDGAKTESPDPAQACSPVRPCPPWQRTPLTADDY